MPASLGGVIKPPQRMARRTAESSAGQPTACPATASDDGHVVLGVVGVVGAQL